MSNREPIKVVADIIAGELGIGSDRIFFYNDGRELPKDNDLYVVLSIRSRTPYGSKTYEENIINGETVTFSEYKEMNVQEIIIAQILSKDSSARLRAYEIQMGMGSTLSQQLQEKYGFHISKIAEVADRSFLEMTSRLTRYDCMITVLCAYQKIKTIDYYNQFPTGDNLYEA